VDNEKETQTITAADVAVVPAEVLVGTVEGVADSASTVRSETSQALAERGTTAVAWPVRTDLPDFIPQNTTAEGTEGIGKEDMRMPRIGLAQGLSPEVQDDGNPRFMPDLKVGQMFHSLDKRIFGKGPLEFQIIRRDPPRYIEFRPRSQGGGVVDPNVPPNDPRTRFTKGPNGASVQPVATKFYDYIVRLLYTDREPELVALSFKGIMLKDAMAFNTAIKARNAPIYAGKYTLTSTMDKNAKGTYAIFKIINSETLDANTSKKGWVSRPLFDEGKVLFDALGAKTIDIDRGDVADDVDGGDTSFPHGANLDQAGVKDI
jgi:hypothetical protein